MEESGFSLEEARMAKISPYVYAGLVRKSLQEKIEEEFNIVPTFLLRKTRERNIVEARAVFVYIMRNIAQWSWQAIAEVCDANHATLIHAYRKCVDLMSYDKVYKEKVKLIESLVKNRTITLFDYEKYIRKTTPESFGLVRKS